MTACPMCIATELGRLGVPADRHRTYITALEQTPGVLALLRQCQTRAQLDHLTETGQVAP
jgi:hypothetical protein